MSVWSSRSKNTPLGVRNNPLTNSLYELGGSSDFVSPPGSAEVITTESGILLTTESGIEITTEGV